MNNLVSMARQQPRKSLMHLPVVIVSACLRLVLTASSEMKANFRRVFPQYRVVLIKNYRLTKRQYLTVMDAVNNKVKK